MDRGPMTTAVGPHLRAPIVPEAPRFGGSRCRGRRSQRLFGNIDDGALDGDGLGDSDFGGDSFNHPAALHPSRRGGHRHRNCFGFQRGPDSEVGSEHDLEVGSQRRNLRAQGGQLVGGFSPHLYGQLSAQLRFNIEFVLATGGDLPVQLQVVDVPHVSGSGLVQFALATVDHRDEGSQHRSPQRKDDRQAQQFDSTGENQCGTCEDRQYQQRGQQLPPRPAAAAPVTDAAVRRGHGADCTASDAANALDANQTR